MMAVDDLALFDRLAEAMNADRRYEPLGELDLDLALVMRRGSESFRVMLSFRDLSCTTVAPLDVGQEASADCWLEGDLADWEAMFADIAANGGATGEWTLNTLTIMGERLRLRATDPMGWDKFHRFNQTLQEFFDAAGRLASQEDADAVVEGPTASPSARSTPSSSIPTGRCVTAEDARSARSGWPPWSARSSPPPATRAAARCGATGPPPGPALVVTTAGRSGPRSSGWRTSVQLPAPSPLS